jgi:ketosteroid isomerase-like protein
MSQGNIATLRDQIDALNQGDLDRWLKGFDPEVEFRMPPGWPDEGEGKGREAALASMKSALDVAENVAIHLRDITELDSPDRLLVSTHIAATGAGSGVPVAFDRYDVITMRDGRVYRDEIFLSREEALEAAGLRE